MRDLFAIPETSVATAEGLLSKVRTSRAAVQEDIGTEVRRSAGDSGESGKDCGAGRSAPKLSPMTRKDQTARDDTSSARLARGRRRDLARLLPIAGAVLLASPLLGVASGGGPLFGIPAGVIYVFGVWGGLILAAGLMARRLHDDIDDD